MSKSLRIGAIFAVALPLSAAVTNVRTLGTTSTQAVIAYTAPDSGACRMEVSEVGGYQPPVHDVNATLFPGADLDNRPGNVADGRHRVFVIGRKAAERSGDGNVYSRALQTNTTHYFRITCGSDTASGTFTTTNIPLGMTYSSLPQPDPDHPGMALIPTLIGDNPVIDPDTGVYIKRAWTPGETLDGAFPSLGSGGSSRICTAQKVGAEQGFLCAFEPSLLYYYIPATGEHRYLGSVGFGGSAIPGISTGAQSASVPHVVGSNVYIYTTGGQADRGETTHLVRGRLTGYGSHPNGWASVSEWTDLIPDVKAAIHALDPVFDPAKYHCGLIIRDGLSYGHLECKSGGQNSYGWLARVGIASDGSASITHAKFVSIAPECRWCGIHESAPAGPNALWYSASHMIVWGSAGYVVTLGTALTADTANATITVSGEPTSLAGGDVPDIARVGDYFVVAGSNETIRIVAKNSPTEWVIQRGLKDWQHGGPTGVHEASAGTLLYALCYPAQIYWNFFDGTMLSDGFVSGHFDYGPDTGPNVLVQGSNSYRLGDLLTFAADPEQFRVLTQAYFARKYTFQWGTSISSHPSYLQLAAPSGEQAWVSDEFPLSGAGGGVWGIHTLVSGKTQTYKITYLADYEIPLQLWRKHLPTLAYSGYKQLRDVSGPGSVLADDAAGDYCVAALAGECLSGSQPGDIFASVPGVEDPGCTASENPNPGSHDLCVTNMFMFANKIAQVGWTPNREGMDPDAPEWNITTIPYRGTGYSRVLSGGLGGIRQIVFPAKPLPDASWLLFTTVQQGTATNPRQDIVMMKLPPTPAKDSVRRDTFIPVAVELGSAPEGTATVVAEFGYAENGGGALPYCTSRRETCVAAGAAVNEANPFYWQHENPAGLACASGCTLVIPALPQRVLYYRVKYRDAGGSVIQTGPLEVHVTL